MLLLLRSGGGGGDESLALRLDSMAVRLGRMQVAYTDAARSIDVALGEVGE